MSDGLTAQPASPELLDARPETTQRSPWVFVPAQALAIVALFAAIGAAAGWLWYKLWDVPSGVVAGGQKFDASHAPVFVFPNPLNPRKYVVINSGFTFHDQANNAMQSPKLPDWAIVDVTKPGNNYRYLPLFVAAQGFFDERWQLQGRR